MTVTHFMPEFLTKSVTTFITLVIFLWTETYRSHWLNNDCHSSQDVAVLLFCPVLAQRRPGGMWRLWVVSQRCWKKTQGDSSVMWLINDLNILKHLDILGYTMMNILYHDILGTGWTAERELSELWWHSCLWEQSWRNLKGKTTSVPEAATVLRSRMPMVVNVCTLLIPITYIYIYTYLFKYPDASNF